MVSPGVTRSLSKHHRCCYVYAFIRGRRNTPHFRPKLDLIHHVCMAARCYMWIYLRRTSYQSGIIRASLRFSLVYRLGGYVSSSLFLGFLLFLFGTRGRDRSYSAPQRSWGFKSLGNPFSKYPYSPFLWSCRDLGSSCHTRRFKIISGSRFSSYRSAGSSSHRVLGNGILRSTLHHFRRYLWFYFPLSHRVLWVLRYYRDHSLDDTRYLLIYRSF
jgi:hypothetical protein